MHRIVALGLALLLLALTAEGAAACSPAVRDNVQIHCGEQRAIVGGNGKSWNLQGALDLLGDACGPHTDELQHLSDPRQLRTWPMGKLEYFIDGGTTLIYEPWSPQREQALAAEREAIRFSECNYVQFERIGNWIRRMVQQRPHCVDVISPFATCGNAPRPSLWYFLLYILTHPGGGARSYLLFGSGVLAFVALAVAAPKTRGVLREALAFGPFRAAMALIVLVFTFCAGFGLDGFVAAAVAYLLTSLLAYGVIRLPFIV